MFIVYRSPKGNIPSLLDRRKVNRKILWCITLPELARLEIELIAFASQAIELDFEITIRNHPHQHITDERVTRFG